MTSYKRQATQVVMSGEDEFALNRGTLGVFKKAKDLGAVVSGPTWYGSTAVLSIFTEGTVDWLTVASDALERLAIAGSEVCTVTSMITEREKELP